jgi:hypothetical protein
MEERILISKTDPIELIGQSVKVQKPFTDQSGSEVNLTNLSDRSSSTKLTLQPFIAFEYKHSFKLKFTSAASHKVHDIR